MNLPTCPNVRERYCERSDLRLLGEDEYSWSFMCATCKLLWKVSKPRTKEKAQYENRIERVQKASEREREQARRTKYFIGGAR